ncbi:hypothetical protein ACTJJ0_31575 [Chitinophaga sp. 22321]|uniref:Helix-turn-helix transcriptional regulator n=1 Tax=Chitinophaga hostae TaxID=2831022 RepID=A0ABS5JBS8_9BACT|nr:helix-turn-helix transcriptional regulator [Chitinophaga hostae]MBS0031902.1 helix-turn-helix transcriptional regulator [Chitinophaga hostae]
MKQPDQKYLLINRYDDVYTTYEHIPSYLHPQLIPYAKCYTDIDDNGVIIDQKIELQELSIFYHLIHLREGVALTTVPADEYYISACVSGFTENDPSHPLKLLLSKKGGAILNPAANADAVISEKEFIVSFNVNVNTNYIKGLAAEFPVFGIIEKLGKKEAKNPTNRLPFQVNNANYQVINRMLRCKLVGTAAEYFFRRNALDFYMSYLRYLGITTPLMLRDSHHQQLKEIAQYIIQHPAEARNKETLCDKFGVVPEFLETPFEQEFLISVEELILQENMAIAFKMITETNHTLTYISTLTKHNSWEELAASFEQYYKCTIADLRKAQ